MTLKNLTPYPLAVLDPAGILVAVILSDGPVARVGQIDTPDPQVPSVPVDGHDVPVVNTAFGDVEDLPAPQEDVFLIVSQITAMAAAVSPRGAADLLVPAMLVREGGLVVACRGFSRIPSLWGHAPAARGGSR